MAGCHIVCNISAHYLNNVTTLRRQQGDYVMFKFSGNLQRRRHVGVNEEDITKQALSFWRSLLVINLL